MHQSIIIIISTYLAFYLLLSIYILSIYPSINLSIYLSMPSWKQWLWVLMMHQSNIIIYLPIYLLMSLYLSIFLSTYLSICDFLKTTIMSINDCANPLLLYIYLSIFQCLSIYLYLSVSIYLCLSISIYMLGLTYSKQW